MSRTAQPLPLFPVMLETLAFSLAPGSDGEAVACRRRVVPMSHRGSPVEQVRTIVGLTGDPTGTLVHGTSWRIADGAVHLTWAVAPDPDPDGEGQSLLVRTEGSPGGRNGALEDPAPGPVEVSSVVDHAAQHVAWLLAQDPDLFTSAKEPALWQAFRALRRMRARAL